MSYVCVLSHFSHVQLLATLWTCNTPGSSVHRILQVRILEWVAISFSYLFLPFINQFQFSSILLLSELDQTLHHTIQPCFRHTHHKWVAQATPGSTSGKEPTCQSRRHKRHGLIPWVGKIPWRRKWQPTPVFLPGKSRGKKSLVDYSPRGCKRVGDDLATEQ